MKSFRIYMHLHILGVFSLLLLSACGGNLKEVGPPSDLKIEANEQMLARGKYLSFHVTLCVDCHSTRDFSYFSGPPAAGTFGMGGMHIGKEEGFPGEIYTDNITPAALSGWTDGEILRATVSGVGKNGEVLLPLMPYENYNHLSQEDANAIIAYIKTLDPIENKVPDSKMKFPLSMFLKTMPKAYHPEPTPKPENKIEYGKYLATISGCAHCHTKMKGPGLDEDMLYAGGMEAPLPGGNRGISRSVNITPHKTTGIGNWKRDDFISKFKEYEMPYDQLPKVKDGEFNTIMPWGMYAGMTEEDLGAIYDFLMTLEPIENKVEPFSPPGESKK